MAGIVDTNIPWWESMVSILALLLDLCLTAVLMLWLRRNCYATAEYNIDGQAAYSFLQATVTPYHVAFSRCGCLPSCVLGWVTAIVR
ncbi:hypothetical protein J3A83DRAFT_1412032 [Scleroderma citrinum]